MSSSSLVEQPFELFSAAGEPMAGEIRYRSDGKKAGPVVIICHSFMAFKNWGFFPFAAMKIAQNGFAAVTFNFSLNGVEDSGNRITDFSKFERNTISREISDLSHVTDAVASNVWNISAIDPQRII